MAQDVGRTVESAGKKPCRHPECSRGSCARRCLPRSGVISNPVPHTSCPYSHGSEERLDTDCHCSGLHLLCEEMLTPKQVPAAGERWQQRALHICCCQTRQPCTHAPDGGQAVGGRRAGKREVQERVGFSFSILGVGVGVKLKPHGLPLVLSRSENSQQQGHWLNSQNFSN